MHTIERLAVLLAVITFPSFGQSSASRPARAEAQIGREVAIAKHLQDGEEFQISLPDLVDYGKKLFTAVWTEQEGGGRPLTKGNGKPLSDPQSPLVGARSFNRISAPDSNSCAGCHNLPFGIAGGGGDIVANVFVLGQRFDFATFDRGDSVPTRGSMSENMQPATLQSIADSRATTAMFGAGYLEMLARQITDDLRKARDKTPPGESRLLFSKGIYFGKIVRGQDGRWDTSQVEGLAAPSLVSSGPDDPPSLVVRPWHQAGAVVSLREFTNNAFNHHHGMQSTERFGIGADPDGDGFVNELTRADITASVVYQAVLPPPGRVIPNDPVIEDAVLLGESLFQSVGCAACHVPRLKLDRQGWIYSEPNPYNPLNNLQVGQAQTLRVDLTSTALPQPRLPVSPVAAAVEVPAYTDFKLHDICDGPDDPNGEALDMQQLAGSPGFTAGNRKFLTRRLWGSANEPPFFHHGRFPTLRQAVLAHSGEALASRRSFEALEKAGQNAIIEFLKTLQVLPPGTKDLIVDENYNSKAWPPVR